MNETPHPPKTAGWSFAKALLSNVERLRTSGAIRILLRLAATVAANVASSHALLLVTAATAAAAAALNPLRSLNTPALALAVALSYSAWLVGLALNAHANWKLLERDGVSVSATSKLLHDAAGRAGSRRALRYAATVFGFVVWEAIEEVPWVLGALGIQAAAANNHGWSFLAGSNAGAAVYNLAQSGLLSRIHARRRPAPDTPRAERRQ